MKILKSILTAAALSLLMLACSDAPLVIQGTVIEYRSDSMTLKMRDENPPNSELILSLKNTEMGMDPVAGDKVRISYREINGELTAIRVMNLSHQQDLQKGGH